jgi:hypothetical protein
LATGSRKAIRRRGSRCCARAASGHVAAALPTTLMKSRRLIACARPKTGYRTAVTYSLEGVAGDADVRFGWSVQPLEATPSFITGGQRCLPLAAPRVASIRRREPLPWANRLERTVMLGHTE